MFKTLVYSREHLENEPGGPSGIVHVFYKYTVLYTT